MNFKAFSTTILLLLAFSSSHIWADQPNVIFIMADDLGYNDLSCMGQKNFSTPNIDRMAKGGMTFTQFYAGSTVCAPSRACFLTGMHTGHVYQRFNGNVQFREDPNDITIAHRLKKAGYRTAMIGKSGLSCNSTDGGLPNRKGFDHFFGFVAHAAAHRYYPKTLFRNGQKVSYPKNYGKEGEEYSGDLFLREAIDWISDNKDHRFFLHLSLQQPHADLQVPDAYRNKFVGRFDEKPFPGGHYRAEQHPQSTVAGMITYLDDSVGKILDCVKELGLDRQTLFIFTSDNGPHFEGGHHARNFDSNGPLRGGKRDLYEGGIRVPFIAQWTGTVKAGSTSDFVGAFWDFPATACELAGIAAPEKTDGISIVPTLTGKGIQKQHDYLYWEFYEQGGKQAVRNGNWKAIRLNVKKDRNGPIELYDLAKDIGETNDQASQFPDIIEQMKNIMTAAHSPSNVVSFEQKKRNNRKQQK